MPSVKNDPPAPHICPQNFLPTSHSPPDQNMDRIFGNGSTSHTTSWEPEPLRRGTFSILSTCFVTLGLCVWTAIHLNVPAHKGWLYQRWCKLGWMMLGFLAPEVVCLPGCLGWIGMSQAGGELC